MAIKKNITTNNGIKINYHRISSTNSHDNILEVKVKTYTDESYRIKEKENKKIKDEYHKLLNSIYIENLKPKNEQDEDKIKKESDKANTLVNAFEEDLDLSILEFKFEFEDIKDLNYSNIYNLIKEREEFKDSEDLM